MVDATWGTGEPRPAAPRDATRSTGEPQPAPPRDATRSTGEPAPGPLPDVLANITADPALIADCVHCGFCLPTCPTYVLWGAEADSPRGRIYLMGSGEPLSDSMVEHFDNCLGCMSCVTACPSGVQYDRLIEQTRARVEQRHPRGAGDRMLRAAIFALFPYPGRLRLLRWPLRAWHRTGLSGVVSQILPPRLRTLESLAPSPASVPRPPERVSARGTRRAVVGMLTGCVQDAFFPDVNAATIRVLAAEGCDVIIPRGQGCCGALSVHNGRVEEAERFARRLAAVFDRHEIDYLVVNAAGCGSTLKDYERLLGGEFARFSSRVRDLSELLDELGPVAERHPLPVTVAYHDACHLAHAQGVRAQPRSLLNGIPGLELREIADPEICCGSAGIWNVLNPEPAAELGDRKAANVLATGAKLLVTANPGCLMQVAAAVRKRGGELRFAHTAQVLDASLRNLGVDALSSRD